MAAESKKKIELEIVFLDIVGYSKQLTNEEHALIDQRNQVVRSASAAEFETR